MAQTQPTPRSPKSGSPAGVFNDAVHKSAPSFSFGAPLPISSETPGPGPAYNLTALTRRGADHAFGCTIKPRWDDKAPRITPGPGSYTPQSGFYKDTKPAVCTIGKSKDPPIKRMPGPGDYNVSPKVIKSLGPAFSFSKSSGGGAIDPGFKAKLPGPGQYQPSPTKGSNSPKYTMGLPNKPPALRPHPGPGSHFVEEAMDKTLTRSPSYKMGPAPKSPTSPKSGSFATSPSSFVQKSPVFHSSPTSQKAGMWPASPTAAQSGIGFEGDPGKSEDAASKTFSLPVLQAGNTLVGQHES